MAPQLDQIAFDQWFSQTRSDLGSSRSIEASILQNVSDSSKDLSSSSSTTFAGDFLGANNSPRTSHVFDVADQSALHDAIDTIFSGDDDFALRDDSLLALLAGDHRQALPAPT